MDNLIKFIITLVILLLTTNSYSETEYFFSSKNIFDEKKPDRTTNTQGVCSQKMINVSAGNNVIQKCTVYIKTIQINSIRKLRKIKNNSENITFQIEKIENYSKISDKNIRKKTFFLKKQLIEIQKEYYHQKIDILKLEQQSNYLSSQQKINSSDIREINENNQKMNEEIIKIDASIADNKISIDLIEDRVTLIENDVGELMNEFANGNLTEVGFYGIGLGAEKIGNVNYSAIGVEYERLMKIGNKKLSLLVEFKKLNGTKKYSYKTLNGLDEIEFSSANDFYAIGIGSKLFFNHRNRFQNYIGSIAGTTWGDEKSKYVKLLAGMEFYQKFHKISLDFSYNYYQSIKDKKIEFSPLGSTEPILETMPLKGSAIMLKFSTR